MFFEFVKMFLYHVLLEIICIIDRLRIKTIFLYTFHLVSYVIFRILAKLFHEYVHFLIANSCLSQIKSVNICS